MYHVLVSCFIVQVVSLPLNTALRESYDYIVVGGGPGGLTVANRLSEDPNITVLLLEAGPADEREPYVEIPGLLGLDIGSRYDWNFSTEPQIYLDGQSRNFPLGHALGGGTLLNGMLWHRGGKGDYDDWVSLGNPGWSWNDMLPYFKKSESFTPLPSSDLAVQFSVEEDPSVHGSSGPVNVSFPRYYWNSSAVLFSALNELGVPTAYDPNNGQIAGASFLPFDLDPETQTRATARKSYFDPVVDRTNLWVSTGQFVTQILFENASANPQASLTVPGSESAGEGTSPGVPGGIYGNTTSFHPPRLSIRGILRRLWGHSSSRSRLLRRQQSENSRGNGLRAVGVEFGSSAGAPRQRVSATREVIVSAGAIHSPQLLMLSGIGPSAHLQSLQIPLNMVLPGVGQNLQDHGQAWTWYPYYNDSFSYPSELGSNNTFTFDAWLDYWANRTGPLTISAFDGVAFPALPFILNGSHSIVDMVSAQAPQQYLSTGVDSTVLAGYASQLRLLTNALADVRRAGYEIINANDGVLTVANMRPLSRGEVRLRSSQPFDPPAIDPRYGSNPTDLQILLAACRFNERLIASDSLSVLQPVQMMPEPAETDEEILSYLRSRIQTEYHPSGTCAMMPQNQGGVVNSDLMVYGTENVRVVDASIMPMLPAAHLQAVVYAIGEKAADIIKAANGDTTALPSPPATAVVSVVDTTFTTVVQTVTVLV